MLGCLRVQTYEQDNLVLGYFAVLHTPLESYLLLEEELVESTWQLASLFLGRRFLYNLGCRYQRYYFVRSEETRSALWCRLLYFDEFFGLEDCFLVQTFPGLRSLLWWVLKCGEETETLWLRFLFLHI